MPRKDGKKTRERLIDSAVEIFSKKGFYYSRVGDIVKRAGVTQGAFYVYFTDKDEILVEIYKTRLIRFSQVIDVEVHTREDFELRLNTIVSQVVERVVSNPNETTVIVAQHREIPYLLQGSPLLNEVEMIVEDNVRTVSGLFQGAQRKGFIMGDLDCRICATIFLGQLNELALMCVRSRMDPAVFKTQSARYVRFFLKGCGFYDSSER
ncbi:MAG: TetR/AcrR family transcriptional regulator [Bacillota bacterium]